MTTTLRLDTRTSDAAREGELVRASAVTVADVALLPEGIPFMIPLGQAYYWSAAWQSDLRDSMRALEAGEIETFDSDDPNDVVRWLFSDDDA